MRTRAILIPVALILVILTVSVILHLRWCGTPFNLTDKVWQDMVNFHSDVYPYNIRILTTPVVEALHELTGLSLKVSFGLLQFSLIFVLGLAFYRLLGQLGIRPVWKELGLASLLLAMPLFYAISEPMHTWDDIWGYLFLTLCASALVLRRFYLAGFWFMAACFSREQTLIYFPAYAAGVVYLGDRTQKIRLAAAIAAPLLLFGVFFASVWQTPEPVRFRLIEFNFDGFLRTRDSIYSIFMAYGWLWLGCILALLEKAPAETDPALHRALKVGTLYAVPATLIFACAFTLVRETRILFPPAVLIVPLVTLYLQEKGARVGTAIRRNGWRWAIVLVALALLGLGIWLGHVAFPKFEYRSCPVFSRLWAGVQIGIGLGVAWMVLVARLARRPPGEPEI